MKDSDKNFPEDGHYTTVKKELINEMTKIRNKKKLSQRDLELICGIKQPFIARIESHCIDPRITTILRIIKPMGYTLTIVPDKTRHEKKSPKP